MSQQMVRTSRSFCRQCRFGMDYGGRTAVYCNYLEMTGKLRDCPVGWCDKYQPRKRKKI